MCSPGYRKSDLKQYLSTWATNALSKGNTEDNRLDCWNLAQQNVAKAVGIYHDYEVPYCRAITNADKLMPWPKYFPDNQDSRALCIVKSQLTNGNCIC